MKEGPIGIFDSGVGGLTVAKAITEALPNESIVYYGDTKHLPYGEKSARAIIHYSEQISEYLVNKGCKCIIIACNSASTAAYEYLKESNRIRVPIIDVVNPLVQKVSELSVQKLGIIATRMTIRSDQYRKKLRLIKPTIEVSQMATPLLVPMIEEGFYRNDISEAIIRSYLDDPKFGDIEAMLLACTHYPLIKKEIKQVLGPAVQVLDSTDVVSKWLSKILIEKDLNNDSGKQVKHAFYVSDLTQSFERTARYFYEGDIPLELEDIW